MQINLPNIYKSKNLQIQRGDYINGLHKILHNSKKEVISSDCIEMIRNLFLTFIKDKENQQQGGILFWVSLWLSLREFLFGYGGRRIMIGNQRNRVNRIVLIVLSFLLVMSISTCAAGQVEDLTDRELSLIHI